MKYVLFLAAVLIMGSGGLAQTAPALCVPAAGTIDLDEFTIEMWVMLAFDPQQHHEGQIHRGYIFHLDYADPAYPTDCIDFYLFTQLSPRENTVRAITYINTWVAGDRLLYSRLGNFPADATRNSWHHVSLAVKGRKRVMTNSGQPQLEDELNGPFAHMLREKAVLLLGNNPRRLPSLVAIDEVKISSVARSYKELLSNNAVRPAIDRYTTLLITFDDGEISGDGKTIRPTLAAAGPASVLQFPDGARLIDGKFGKALAIFPPGSE